MESIKELLSEKPLEDASGGSRFTENRYLAKCAGRTKAEHDCRGFLYLISCDHYNEKRNYDNDKKSKAKWDISCDMMCFPPYSELRKHDSQGGT